MSASSIPAKGPGPSPTSSTTFTPAIGPIYAAPMRVVVDFNVCESNALCMGVAPEVFEVRDDDFLYVLDENPPESLRAKVEEAVRICPKQAITIED